MKTSSFFAFKGPGRISIARSKPRFAPKSETYKPLAPGPWFNDPNLSKEDYEKRYHTEILANLNPQKVWDDLHALANNAEPVLLCWEKPPFNDLNNYCHRHMAAKWLENALNVQIPEI